MTSFQIKRLKYFIKVAEKSEYVQLGPGDVDWLKSLLKEEKTGPEATLSTGVALGSWGNPAGDALEKATKGKL